MTNDTDKLRELMIAKVLQSTEELIAARMAPVLEQGERTAALLAAAAARVEALEAAHNPDGLERYWRDWARQDAERRVVAARADNERREAFRARLRERGEGKRNPSALDRVIADLRGRLAEMETQLEQEKGIAAQLAKAADNNRERAERAEAQIEEAGELTRKHARDADEQRHRADGLFQRVAILEARLRDYAEAKEQIIVASVDNRNEWRGKVGQLSRALQWAIEERDTARGQVEQRDEQIASLDARLAIEIGMVSSFRRDVEAYKAEGHALHAKCNQAESRLLDVERIAREMQAIIGVRA